MAGLARFAGRQIRASRGRAIATGLAILVAAVGFITLTSAVRTTGLTVHRLASSNYRPAYDILVRPAGSQSAYEREHHLVQANYLGGTYGGITLAQWQRVLHLAGVSVAAPIANVGYVTLPVTFMVPVPTTSAPVQLYRITLDWTTDNGLSSIPGVDSYVYITDAPFHAPRDELLGPDQIAPDGTKLHVCDNYPATTRALVKAVESGKALPTGLLGLLGPQQSLSCLSTSTPSLGDRNPDQMVTVQFPVLLSGIDPAQEAKLMHLPSTMVHGSYLTEGAGLTAPANPGHGAPFTVQSVPVLASTRTFVDDTLSGSVTRLDVGAGDSTARLLADPAAPARLARLTGTRVGSVRISSQGAYQKVLSSIVDGTNVYISSGKAIGGFWSLSPTRYSAVGTRHVAARATSNPVSVWDRFDSGSGIPAPPGSGDTAFHRVQAHVATASGFTGSPPPGADADTATTVGIKLVGQYDPSELPGFSPLNKVPLQTYYPPTVTGSTDRDRQLLGNRPMGPDLNVAGYLTQPPLLLTTITAAAQLQNPKRYPGGHPAAPISSIRVRVAGVTGLNAASRARVRAVAQQIAESTGLAVQITAGSSPTPVTVDLPAGRYGRPALQVTQDWVQQGAVASLVSSVDAESLGLFVLVLVAAALLVGGGVNASVRARRTDLGVLAAVGWTPRELSRAVRAEVLGVAGVAGAAGVGVAIGLVRAFGLHLALWQTVLVLPVALAVALVAGWWPARTAARADPTLTLSARVGGRRRGGATRVRHLAWVAVARRPGRAVLGGAGLAFGVAAVTVLLAVELRFQNHVGATLIGQAAILRVHGAELAAAAPVALFGAASVADVVGLDLTERVGEFATLAATGWSRPQLARLAVGQGGWLGGLGSLAGALAGFAVGAVLTASPGFVALTALVGLVGGTILAVLATAVPVARVARQEPAAVLAARGRDGTGLRRHGAETARG